MKRYENKILIALLLACSTLLIGCGNHSPADEWGAKTKFDVKEYDRSYDIYLEHFDDELSDVPRLNVIADSLYRSGEKTGNYAVQVNALMMKVIACTITEDNDSMVSLYRQALDIAKANGHQQLYFSIYNNFCQALFEANHPSAMRETKKMFDEANELNSPSGLKNGHRMMGVILQFFHGNAASAIREFKQAEALADSTNSSPVYMFDLQMELATAYASNDQLKEAKEILRKAAGSEMMEDEYFQMSYNITRLGILEKSDSLEAFNELFSKIFDNDSGRSRFSEEQIRDWNVRRLIKNRRFDEAKAAISGLEKAESRHIRMSHLCAQKGDYKNAYEELSKLNDVRDSVRYVLNMNELIDMESQLHSADLKKKAAEAIAERRFTTVIAIAVLLLFLALASVLFIYRQRVVNKKLKQANDVKIKFLQNMSHELRTPIHHVSGFAQLMDDGMCDEDPELRLEAVKAIVHGTEDLTQMIENIMVTIEMDTEEKKLQEMRDFVVADLVDEEFYRLHHDTQNTRLNIVKDVNLPEGFTIKSHAVMIKHVIANMLSNAVKFTEEGTITFSVSLKQDNDKPAALVFACTDTGCGIAPEHREKVFERFFKVNEFIPGTGLGLAVCRMIAQRLGGTIVLDDSYTGPGSRFVFTVQSS